MHILIGVCKECGKKFYTDSTDKNYFVTDDDHIICDDCYEIYDENQFS